MASLQKNYPYRKKKEKYQEISDMVLIDSFLDVGVKRVCKNYLISYIVP